MQPPRPAVPFRSSLPVKIGLVVLIFIAAVAGVRVLSLDHLVHVGAVSDEVRNRWLDSIRFLADLNDRVSDTRAAEAEILLSPDATARDNLSAERENLVDAAAKAADDYKSVGHDAEEIAIFSAFLQRWTEYVGQARLTASLSQSGQSEAAVSLFRGDSRSSFQGASTDLRRLIALTETKAETARNNAVQAIANAQRWIADLVLGLLLLFVALAAYLWLTVSRPLLELAGRMRQLASYDTNFSLWFEGWRDEIGEMARALAVFRRNTIELLESRKRLASQAEVLARSLDKERALATEQRNFITTISHEFRTPLMAIDGHAQRLLATRERATPADIAGRADKIRAAVFRMTSLVASLTNAMELAHGELRARTRRFDLREMLQNLAAYYGEIGLGGGLEARIGGLPPEITGDPELLYQVFSNLLSNAFKYSPEDGIVTLTAGAKDGFVEIAVEDRGLGIPRDEIGRIRERYYRASNVGSIPGTGVGLHLVDEIVRQHGGRLEIDSEEGRGTRMAVILPIDGPARPAEGSVEQDLVRGGRSGDRAAPGGGAERARLHG